MLFKLFSCGYALGLLRRGICLGEVQTVSLLFHIGYPAGSCHRSQQFGWGSLPKMLGLVVISVAALLGCCCCDLVHVAEHFCLAGDGGWGEALSPNAWSPVFEAGLLTFLGCWLLDLSYFHWSTEDRFFGGVAMLHPEPVGNAIWCYLPVVGTS